MARQLNAAPCCFRRGEGEKGRAGQLVFLVGPSVRMAHRPPCHLFMRKQQMAASQVLPAEDHSCDQQPLLWAYTAALSYVT